MNAPTTPKQPFPVHDDADVSFIGTLRHAAAAIGGLIEAVHLLVPDPCAAFAAGKLSPEDHETVHDMIDAVVGMEWLANLIEQTGTEATGTLPVTKDFVRVTCAAAAAIFDRATEVASRLTNKTTQAS
jgi:hypothetical protein